MRHPSNPAPDGGARFLISGLRNATKRAAARAPAHWLSMNAGTLSGAMPENVGVNARARVTAGFAKEVDDVNQ